MATSDRRIVRMVLYNHLPYLSVCALALLHYLQEMSDISWISDLGVWPRFQFSSLAAWEHDGPAADVVHGPVNIRYYAIKSL